MRTQCPECNVDHKNLPSYELFEFAAGLSMCPSCGCAVETTATAESPEAPTLSKSIASIATPFSESLNAVLNSVDIETPLFDTDEIMESADASGTLNDDIAKAPPQRTPPFRLSVNKVPPSGDASSVCLEIKLTNLTNAEVRGHLWLSDEDGCAGRSKSFTLARTTFASAGEFSSESIYPQLQIEKGSSGHIAVRIQPVDYGGAFWQGDLLLSREKNGSISVGLNIDKSIRAENYLEGIRNGATGDVFNFNTGPMYQSENWQEVSLRLRGPKELADPVDVRRPFFSGHNRPCNSRNEYDENPTSQTAKLTLSSTLPNGREAYVQLIAGTTLHLGRARTWDSATHHEHVPNDIVLRTLASDECDDFISRYHGRIRQEGGSVLYENFSKLGTDVAGRVLQSPGEFIRLRSDTAIHPGRSAIKDTHNRSNSLGLRISRVPGAVKTELYNLLVQDSHLSSGFDVEQCHDVLAIHRTDSLADWERYVFFPHATLVGRNQSICGWQINDPTVQPVHAILLWFDGSFWIEPSSPECVVKVNSKAVSHHRVRRVTAGATLEIGNQHFIVLPEWKQHIIDCRCCQGHG